MSATPRANPNGDMGTELRTPKPSYRCDLSAIVKNTPQEMKDQDRWVLWRYEWRKGGWTKPPYQINGTSAMVNEPLTWTTFEKVLNHIDPLNGGSDNDGIGFNLLGRSHGIDFDGMRETELDVAYTRTILKLIGNPYSEISPSDDGFHGMFEYSGNITLKSSPKIKGKHYGIDLYKEGSGRYFTFTGAKFSGNGVPKISDETAKILQFLIDHLLDAEFKKLWCGDGSSKYIPDDGDRSGSGVIWNLAAKVKRLLEKKGQKVDQKLLEKYLASSGAAHYEPYRDEQRYRDLTLGKLFKGIASPAASHEVQIEAHWNLDMVPLSQIKAAIQPWLWENRLPMNALSNISGIADQGKSLVLYDILARISTGADFPDGAKNPFGEPKKVLLFFSEGSSKQL